MKILNSKILDLINNGLFVIQLKLNNLKNNSFLLSNIDFFIVLSIISIYVVSIFAQNSTTAIFAFLLPFLVILKTLMTKGEKLELEICNFYLIIYLFICFISNFTSSLPIQSFYGFSKTLLYFAFYLALCQFLKNNKNFIIIIMFAIAVLTAGESVIGLLQNAAKVANIATWQDTSYVNPEDIMTRVYGTLKPYNPNLFGGWLIASIPALIGMCALFFYKKHIIPAFTSLIFLFISVLSLFYSGCRGAYIALFFIFCCLLIVLFNVNKICRIASIMAAAFGGAFILLHHGIFQRLMSIFILRGDSSTSFRMNVYNSAIQMFFDNPIFGIGAGNKVFREIYGLYMLSGFDALSCYSVFLEIAVESGIFALIAFLLFIGSLLINGIKKYIISKDRAEKIILFTAFISVFAVMLHGLVDTVYFRPQIQFIFWTMASVLTVLSRNND